MAAYQDFEDASLQLTDHSRVNATEQLEPIKLRWSVVEEYGFNFSVSRWPHGVEQSSPCSPRVCGHPHLPTKPLMNTERLFVALTLPPAVRDSLAALAQPLPGVAWTNTNQMHVT